MDTPTVCPNWKLDAQLEYAVFFPAVGDGMALQVEQFGKVVDLLACSGMGNLVGWFAGVDGSGKGSACHLWGWGRRCNRRGWGLRGVCLT